MRSRRQRPPWALGVPAALGAILLAQAGMPIDERWALTVIAVLGSQVVTGATNDLADRAEDTAAGRLSKPLVTESLSIGAAVWIASIGLAVQLAASLRLGTTFMALGLVAVASAIVLFVGVAVETASAQGAGTKPAPGAKPAPAAPAPAAAPRRSPGAGPIIVFETMKGSFEIETYPNEAPKTA